MRYVSAEEVDASPNEKYARKETQGEVPRAAKPLKTRANSPAVPGLPVCFMASGSSCIAGEELDVFGVELPENREGLLAHAFI